MTQSEYRAELLMYAVLGAPLVIASDIRKLDDFSMHMLTAPEVHYHEARRICVCEYWFPAKSCYHMEGLGFLHLNLPGDNTI